MGNVLRMMVQWYLEEQKADYQSMEKVNWKTNKNLIWKLWLFANRILDILFVKLNLICSCESQILSRTSGQKVRVKQICPISFKFDILKMVGVLSVNSRLRNIGTIKTTFGFNCWVPTAWKKEAFKLFILKLAIRKKLVGNHTLNKQIRLEYINIKSY